MGERVRFSPAPTGRAHGLPVATLLAFLGSAEAASRLELARLA